MAIIGGFRNEGIIDSKADTSDTIVDFTGFKPSGLTDGNVLGVALYVWSGSTPSGNWIPLKREWL
jgi:hypothetical protein